MVADVPVRIFYVEVVGGGSARGRERAEGQLSEGWAHYTTSHHGGPHGRAGPEQRRRGISTSGK